MDRQMLIKKSAPQPRLRNTGTGGKKRARKYKSTSDVAEGGRDAMAFEGYGSCCVQSCVRGASLVAEVVVRTVYGDAVLKDSHA